MTAFVCKKKR